MKRPGNIGISLQLIVWLLASFNFATGQKNSQRTRQLPTGNFNVLFIAVDDLKPAIGAFGNPDISTPTLDRLAASSMIFTNAHCQQAVCNASRVSILTGCRPDATRTWNLDYQFRKTVPDVITIPQHFKEQGYKTHGVGKIYHGSSASAQDPLSWNDGQLWPTGPHRFYEPAAAALEDAGDNKAASADAGEWDREGNPVTDEHYGDGLAAADAVAKLAEYASRGEPFFLAVGFRKPHLPFACPKKYWDLYDPADIDLSDYTGIEKMPLGSLKFTAPYGGEPDSYTDTSRPYDEPTARRLIHGYMACVSYIDTQIGKVLDALEDPNRDEDDSDSLTDNTVVFLWGDHGWHLGDHSGFWSKHTNYEQATRSPLLIKAPGMDELGTADTVCARPAELVDIYPTLVDLCNLPAPEQPEGLEFQGSSMLPLLEDPAQPWKKAAFSQYSRNIKDDEDTDLIENSGNGMGYSMRTDRYRYTEWWRTHSTDLDANGYITDRDEKLYETPEFVELYDYQTDPLETVNLATNPEFADLVTELSAILAGGNGWSDANIQPPIRYPTLWDDWKKGHQMPGIPSHQLDPSADPDRDLFNNLLEYAIGSDPLTAESGLVEADLVDLEGNPALSLEYHQAISRMDVSLEAISSNNLAPDSWSTSAVTTDTLQTGPNRNRIRAYTPIDPPSTPRFLRLQATQ